MKPGTDFHSFYRQLDVAAQQDIDRHSQRIWAPMGSYLCRQGAESDSVFILEEGVAEVLIETCDGREAPPIAYLSRGDIIGELGVLNDKPRLASIRIAADVYYRRMESGDFLRLLTNIPGFGLYISYRLAERLANTTANLAYNSYCVDLSGKLPNFDLITVWQTVRDGNCTGELKIIGPSKEAIGEFFVSGGSVFQARYMHLFGREALWQMFLDQIEGGFSFTRQETPSLHLGTAYETEYTIADMLLEAAVKRDEFERLPVNIRRLQGTLRRNLNTLSKEMEWHPSALQVWDLIEREPQALRTIWRRSTLSYLSLGRAVVSLLAAGQISVVEPI